MIAELKPAPVETKSPGASSRIQNLKNDLAPRWGEFWDGAIDAAGAELAIVALKAGRIAALTFLGIAAAAAGAALGVYGFILLDRCFAYALSQPEFPVWVSPLVRGALYFGFALAGIASVWGTTVSHDEKKANENICKS